MVSRPMPISIALGKSVTFPNVLNFGLIGTGLFEIHAYPHLRITLSAPAWMSFNLPLHWLMKVGNASVDILPIFDALSMYGTSHNYVLAITCIHAE